ncbi:MAG: UDP-N-acetylglucosamine 1-carboxyvinyltransferase [Candidatus Magasanikbacteria bacterium]|nr:UDP-N-acetylglucosamine 1-carboxyvinyltransferase [Candidatus Magasanikbacteria bacterium]
MSYVVINGGRKLHGAIQNQSAKNSAVAILCAAAAVRGRVVLTAVPQIEEVYRIIELLKSIGVQVDDSKPGTVVLDSSAPLRLAAIDRPASEKTRASLLLFGALAAREKGYKIYKSGGCKLGHRTVRPHLYALENFGVAILSRDRYYEVVNHPLRAAAIVMYESGDTATANAVLAAVLAPGASTIKMASANYQVQDLCYFLNQAGAKISGIGTTTLTIVGVKKLQAVKEYSIMPDPIVAMTYIAAGLVTRSTVTIKNCPLEFLELELYKLQKMGARLTIKNKRHSENGKFAVVDVFIQPSTLVALPDKIEGRPFPGLNMDNLPLFVPILALAKGRTLVHDWAFENRAVYHLELQKLGVKVTLLDPHRVWIEGPTKLVANEVVCPPALRPAVNILIAMLGAKGRSVLRNTYEIDRGYENLYETLNQAGADITVVRE